MPLIYEGEVACECCQRKRVTASAITARYRVSNVKRGGPVAQMKSNRAAIIRDMVRMRRHLMLDGQRALTRILHNFFSQKIEEVCARVEHRARHASIDIPQTKSGIDLGFGSSEEVWKEAIEEVLGSNADVELLADYIPAVQSTAAKAYSRTCIFLGELEAHDAAVNILRRAQNLGLLVTRINDTTRVQLERIINDSIESGATIRETVQALRDAIPQIEAGRIPTIARTEMGRAVDEGTKQAIKESATVVTVDVVGCKAVEPGIPTFDGRPTCNITGVPAQRVDELFFHPNHTGAIVPGSFIGD